MHRTTLAGLVRSLRAKLALSHLAIIFLTISVAGFSLLSLVQGYFQQAMQESLAAQAQLLIGALFPGGTASSPMQPVAPAYNAVQQQQVGNLSVEVGSKPLEPGSEAAPDLSASNLANLANTTVEISSALETHILVLDNRGVVLVDSAAREEGADWSDHAAVASALGGKPESTIVPTAQGDWLYVAVPVWLEDQISGAVYLGQPLRDVASVLADLRVRLGLAAALAMPVSAVLALLLARGISRPVSALTTAAQRLANGDYEYPLQTTSDDELGKLSRAFASMRDELQATEKLRSQFVSDVSHELRTPLTAIKGLVETLRDGAADDSAVRDRFLASMDSETDRLIRLVNDLLTLSRADSQALTLQVKNVDLRQLAEATAQQMSPQAASKSLRLRVEFPQAELLALADADRVQQVLVNLVDNAIQHTPSQGAILITGFPAVVEAGLAHQDGPGGPQAVPFPAPAQVWPLPDGRWALVCVVDSGEGIPQDDLPHVFERFYRADPARSRQRGGSGLGLSIAKALVEAHGGRIWLQSPASHGDDAGGPGTAVSFTLPRPG